jgi:hypothetical protein
MFFGCFLKFPVKGTREKFTGMKGKQGIIKIIYFISLNLFHPRKIFSVFIQHLNCRTQFLPLLQEIFNNSVKADYDPKKFYDEGGKIEIIDERNNYQTGAHGV